MNHVQSELEQNVETISWQSSLMVFMATSTWLSGWLWGVGTIPQGTEGWRVALLVLTYLVVWPTQLLHTIAK